MILGLFEQQVGQQLVQEQILLAEASNWASTPRMKMCGSFCTTAPLAK